MCCLGWDSPVDAQGQRASTTAASMLPLLWMEVTVAHGTDASLNKYEAGLNTAFELGECGKLGLGPGHVREAQVLNRVLQVHNNSLKL